MVFCCEFKILGSDSSFQFHDRMSNIQLNWSRIDIFSDFNNRLYLRNEISADTRNILNNWN